MNTSDLGNQVSKATIATLGTMVTGKSMVVSNHWQLWYQGNHSNHINIDTHGKINNQTNHKYTKVFTQKCLLLLRDFNQTGSFLADFSKTPSMNFHNNMSSVSHAVPCGQIKRQRQMHGPDKANTCFSILQIHLKRSLIQETKYGLQLLKFAGLKLFQWM